MSADGNKTFRAVVGRLRHAILLAPGLADRDRRIGLVMLEQVNRRIWTSSGLLLTWISVDRLAGALGESGRTVQRARSELKAAGVLMVIKPGGQGRKDTAQLAFNLAWLEDVERDLRGRLAQLGYADDDPDQGDGVVTLKPAIASPHEVPGDAAVALTGPQGDSGVAPTITAAVQGDSSITLNASAPVDISAITRLPVDNTDRNVAFDGLRVTGLTVKGDRMAPERVTAVSPEPCINPGINPAREKRRTKARNGPPDAQRSFMLPIAGARTISDARTERRAQTLLDRAGRLLGDRGRGSLAVSVLQTASPDLHDGILRGLAVGDVELRHALLSALEAVQGDRSVTHSPAQAARTSVPAAEPASRLDEQRVTAAVMAAFQAAAPGIVAAAVQALRSDGECSKVSPLFSYAGASAGG